VFATYFYIFILVFQLYFAESNFDYNKDVEIVNTFILNQNNNQAFGLVRNMEKRGLFTNNDLVRIDRYLSLKMGANPLDSIYSPRTTGDYAIKSLAFFQKHNYSNAVDISMESVQLNSGSDSLIKLYEILVARTPRFKRELTLNKQVTFTKNIRLNEAMNLLDLMKRKEKTLF
jgi:hypothetical protein